MIWILFQDCTLMCDLSDFLALVLFGGQLVGRLD